MAITGSRLLTTARINRIIRTLAMNLEIGRPLRFLDRTPITEAEDGELTGRFTGKIIAADIIADDQEAVVQQAGKIEFTSLQVPNLKIGQRLGQNMIDKMQMFDRRGIAEQDDQYLDWQNQLAENLLNGVRARMNALICAMRLDSFSYNRMGIETAGTWGKPADLKVTPSVPWTTAGSATPLADIVALNNHVAFTYGITYDRITLSTAALRYILATDEFKASATVDLGFAASPAAVQGVPERRRREILGNILGMKVELEDGTYNEVATNGTRTAVRYLPANKVELSREADDGDPAVMDFGNTIVTESVVSKMVANAPDLGGEQSGPVAYYTGRADLNPPDLVIWSVVRGFPRASIPEATAVITAY